MYAISLTSIPPRFDRLGPVLETLQAQRPRPARVLLCLPRTYRRFPGPVHPPALPSGVTALWSDHDLGPATKVIPAARALSGRVAQLIYCDDDWLVPQGWAGALLAAQNGPHAVAASGYGVDRLGRKSENTVPGAGLCDIAQGYSGVLVNPAWLAGPDLDPPEAAWPVDDIWLSGHLARQGIQVRIAARARLGLEPAFDDAHALQAALYRNRTRDQANRNCAGLLQERYGIWPPSD